MCSLICSKAAAFAGIWLKFGHTSDQHRRVSDTEIRFRYLCLSSSFHNRVIPGLCLRFCSQLGSAMQLRMKFLDSYEAQFGKLQLSMNVSFRPRHPLRTNKYTIVAHIFQSVVYCILEFPLFSPCFLWSWISVHSVHQLPSIKTLHVLVHTAHPTWPRLLYQSILEWNIESCH